MVEGGPAVAVRHGRLSSLLVEGLHLVQLSTFDGIQERFLQPGSSGDISVRALGAEGSDVQIPS